MIGCPPGSPCKIYLGLFLDPVMLPWALMVPLGLPKCTPLLPHPSLYIPSLLWSQSQIQYNLSLPVYRDAEFHSSNLSFPKFECLNALFSLLPTLNRFPEILLREPLEAPGRVLCMWVTTSQLIITNGLRNSKILCRNKLSHQTV